MLTNSLHFDAFRPGKLGFNVLVVSPTPTHPSDQGNRKRIRIFCEELQRRGGKIHFLYFPREWAGKIELAAFEAMRDAWDYFHVVAPGFPPPYRTDAPYWKIDDWWDGAIGSFIGCLTSNVSFDLAVVNYAFLSKALTCLPDKVFRILDTHDKLSDRKDLLLSNGIAPEFFYTSREEEEKAFARSQLALAIKEEEREFFRGVYPTPVMTLAHMERPCFLDKAVPLDRPLRFGFIGSANPINRVNLDRFLQKIVPLFPDAQAEMIVAGSICEFFDQEGPVRMMGRVEDVREFYETVDVVVNPFDFSTGLKIKVVEALSYGIPVLGTANAFEGIATPCPYHRLDSLEAMAHLCVQLSRHRRQLPAMAAECRGVFDALRSEVGAAFDAVVSCIKKRILVVPSPHFYKKDTAASQRESSIIRAMSEVSRCLLFYPYPASNDVKRAIEDWQWGITVLYPEVGQDGRVPDAAFVEAARFGDVGLTALLSPDYRHISGLDYPTVLDVSGSDGAAALSALAAAGARPPLVILTDSLAASAAAMSAFPATPRQYLPCVGEPPAPTDKGVNVVWILHGSSGREAVPLDRLLLLLVGQWRDRGHVVAHVVAAAPGRLSLSSCGAIREHDRTAPVGDLDKPDLVVDMACEDPAFVPHRRAALLAGAVICRYRPRGADPEAPGLLEASIAAHGPKSLLQCCHGVMRSNRIRQTLRENCREAVRRWCSKELLAPLRETLRAVLDARQARTLVAYGGPEPVSADSGFLDAAVFDEEHYLAVHPDVRQAVLRGEYGSGQEHFNLYGRFEGRSIRYMIPVTVQDFDEQDYLDRNPDVHEAVRNGEYESGFAHYLRHGRQEQRTYRRVGASN